jgi:hypothetical protein
MPDSDVLLAVKQSLCVACALLLLPGCLSWFQDDDTDTPEAPACGNGKVEDKEQCDKGASNMDAPCVACCRTDCTWQICGDGIVDVAFGEACDNGAGDWRDGCESCVAIEQALVKYSPDNVATTALHGGGWVVAWEEAGVKARTLDQNDLAASQEIDISSSSDPYVQSSLGSVAPVGDGFVAVWRLRSGGDAVQAALYGATGVQTVAPFTFSQGIGGASARNDPDVASALSTGDFVVAWQDNGNAQTIVARRGSANGQPVGDEFPVSTSAVQGASRPAVAVAPDGDFAVVWSGTSAAYDCTTTWLRTYHADGTPWGAEAPAGSTGVPCHGKPAVASLGAQGFEVVWDGRINSFDEEGAIQARRFAWDGTAALPPVAVAPTNLGYGTDCTPRVAADASGRTLVVWQDQRANPDSDILARAYGPDGQPAGGEQRVNLHTKGVQQGPHVTALAAGGFVVGWVGERTSDANAGLFFRRLL